MKQIKIEFLKNQTMQDFTLASFVLEKIVNKTVSFFNFLCFSVGLYKKALKIVLLDKCLANSVPMISIFLY